MESIDWGQLFWQGALVVALIAVALALIESARRAWRTEIDDLCHFCGRDTSDDIHTHYIWKGDLLVAVCGRCVEKHRIELRAKNAKSAGTLDEKGVNDATRG